MPDASQLTLDRIFTQKEFETKSFGPIRWLDGGRGYTTLEEVEGAAGDEAGSSKKDKDKVKEIIRYDTATGERAVLVSAEQLRPPGAEEPLVIKDYTWSEDKQRLLIFTNTKKVWRLETRGDYWVLDLEHAWLKQLGGEGEPSTLMFAKFAPDGRSVAYLRHNNIYVEQLEDGTVTQLTHDGSEHCINGTADWVYEEEFALRDGFCWSPSGRYIAYWQFDTTGIDTFYLINNTDSLYPKLTPIPYPKVGTTNPAARVGVVGAGGGLTTWFDLPGDPRQHYIPKMEWVKTEGSEDEALISDEAVVIQQLNRLQNRNHVFRGRAADGAVETILVEEDEAWLEVRYGNLKWLDGGRAFLWPSERDGWQHLYRVAVDGSDLILLTPGEYDVIEPLAVVEAGEGEPGWLYYIASPGEPTGRYLYRVPLNGGPAERITPAAQTGWHNYNVAPDGRWAVHTYHTMARPPAIDLIRLPSHETARPAETNEALQEKVAALDIRPPEFFRVDIGDGVVLDGWCLKPPDFDPGRRYPVLFYVYGEPAGATVVDAWTGEQYLWHQLLAQMGYVVISVDNRGTPAPRGRAWRKCVYRQVGILSSDEQAAAVQALLAERPYLDPGRVGVWGWSGGGSMTLMLMFKYPELYRVGMAIAAVSHQKYYDTVYQERYMGLPQDNEDGFRDGSPLTHAANLQGDLLIIHGTGDDNVHYQAFEVLVNELIRHNKHFSMMAYPNRTHAIKEGDGTSRHLYGMMTRYLYDHL